jgi:hypothetical protein
MALAQAFTINDNPLFKDTQIIDMFIEPHVFMNKMVTHRNELVINSTIIEIDPRYDYRPDRLAYEIYGQDFWYPAILSVNNMGSMLQFKAETLNFKCRIPDVEAIRGIISSPPPEHINIESMVNAIFKS